jgi:hypothetical protein
VHLSHIGVPHSHSGSFEIAARIPAALLDEKIFRTMIYGLKPIKRCNRDTACKAIGLEFALILDEVSCSRCIAFFHAAVIIRSRLVPFFLLDG